MVGADISQDGQAFQPSHQHGLVVAEFGRYSFSMIQVQITEQARKLADGHRLENRPHRRQGRRVVVIVVMLDDRIFFRKAQHLFHDVAVSFAILEVDAVHLEMTTAGLVQGQGVDDRCTERDLDAINRIQEHVA